MSLSILARPTLTPEESRLAFYVDCQISVKTPLHFYRDGDRHHDPGGTIDYPNSERHIPQHKHPGGKRPVELCRPFARADGEPHFGNQPAFAYLDGK